MLSLEQYEDLTNDTEFKKDEADEFAKTNDVRYEHKDVFTRLKKRATKNG